MQTSGLSFDQAPPISVPFRFFLTIPFFMLAASVLLLWAGPSALLERHNPATLAIVHLLTLGVLSMAMCGALMQLLPVVAGVSIRHPRLVATLVHLNLCAGSLLLAGGFLRGWKPAFLAASICLALGFGVFFVAVSAGLLRVALRNSTTLAITLAVVALLVTVVLGIGLALYWSGYATGLYAPVLHPLWGLAGWVGLLLIGVAYQVVPMFQLTPNYPAHLTRWLAPVLFGLLVCLSFVSADAAYALEILAALAFVVFALTTLHLHRRRRRRQIDITLLFWRVSMTSLIGAVVLLAAAHGLPDNGQAKLELAAGMLMIVGFALGAINGMLYKIVPFLGWFHLQARMSGKVMNMKELLPEIWARRQFRLYLASFLTLLAAVLWPPLVYPAAILFGASALALWHNLLRAALPAL